MRIILAETPRMLRDILYESLLAEPDVALVGEAANLGELRGIVEHGAVNVVMLGWVEADLPASPYQLFDTGARVRILAIADHGRTASLYQLRPHRPQLGEGSPQELLQGIRRKSSSAGVSYTVPDP